MKKIFILNLITACLIALPFIGYAEELNSVDKKELNEIINSLSNQMSKNYVFPEIGTKMAIHIKDELSDGKYKTIINPSSLASQLTEDLRSIANDAHLKVFFDPDRVEILRKQNQELEEETSAADIQKMKRRNFGFKELKILDGNIGYLNLIQFYHPEFAGDAAIAAMNSLSNADSIIFDLRYNGGGSPSMVKLISSYLFDSEEVHLNSLYHRPSDTLTQHWTLPYINGLRRPDRDVYILTSGNTFSAAEEFSYNLKNLKRATLIGEKTGGGAHAGGIEVLNDRFLAWLPRSRAINPITKTNWEGVGVEPHINVLAADALNVAHAHALEKLAMKNEGSAGDYYRWYLDEAKANATPVKIDTATLESYAGQFGPRLLTVNNGQLYYSRNNRTKRLLKAIDLDTFSLVGVPSFRLQVIKDKGRVIALKSIKDNGATTQYLKEI
ncbi:MAG: S41 family peptidase [Colwellia sp.]|nr:S41 family peptidase [Colwellia sp.]